MRTTRPNATNQGMPAHRSPVLLEDLLSDLLWPKLLGAWRLALAPGRVVICFGFLVGVLLLDKGYAALAKVAGHPIDGSVMGRVLAEIGGELGGVFSPLRERTPNSIFLASTSVYELFVRVPMRMFEAHWPLMVFVLPIVIVALAITAGAVCRSVAMQVSLGATLPWRSASRFGFGRVVSLTGALVGPVLAIWLIAAAMAGCGWLLFSWKIGSVIGGLLFGVFALVALGLAVLSLGYVLASPMIVPALACEGTDPFDAVQRAYSYVIVRPGRLLGYYLISGVLLLVGVGAAALVVVTAGTFVSRLTGAPVPELATYGEMDRAPDLAKLLVNLWVAVPLTALAAYVLSLILTLSTIVYLIMRRVVDGQDISELWVPGGPATSAEAIAMTAPTQVPITPAPGAEKADYT